MTDLINLYNKVLPLIKELEEGECLIGLAVARKKYNQSLSRENDSNKPFAYREIITKKNWQDKLRKLYTLANNYNDGIVTTKDFNIYVSINPRSFKKAYKQIKEMFAEIDYNNRMEALEHMDALMVKCLARPEGRSRKQRFLIDIDSTGTEPFKEVIYFFDIRNLPFGIFKTRNGFHITAAPFNTQDFQTGVINKHELYHKIIEVKTDGMLQVWHG